MHNKKWHDFAIWCYCVAYCVTCVCMDIAGKRVCAGYEDGTVKVWDLKTATAIHTFSGE